MIKDRIVLGLLVLTIGIFLIWLYKHSPRKVEFLGQYHKVGAHRVNSLEKLESALKYFEIIELDLVYIEETDILDVNHPPTPSTGLSFAEYMKAIEGYQPFLWLDIKNLDETNTEKILYKLNTLLTNNKFPTTKVLIETRFPEKLALFASEGYHTSFYLKQNLHTLKREDLNSEIEKIKAILHEQPSLGISTEHFDYEILKKHFPQKTKYLWSFRHSKIKDYSLLRSILEDETVAIVLTRYNPF